MLKTAELTGLAQYLLQDAILDFATIEAALKNAQQQGMTFSRYLVQTHLLESPFLLNYCAKKFSLPIFDLKNYDFTWLDQALIPFEIIDRYRVIPLYKDEINLHIGITDPTHPTAVTTISFQTGLRVRTMLVDERELENIIHRHCSPHILNSQLESTLSKMSSQEEIVPAQSEQDEPVIQFVDNLILDAIEKKITDIHIEPYAEDCRIRFRRDGLLYEATTLPLHLSRRIITRLKIMADLNIAEKRLPQDGRIAFKKEGKMDIRINTCPFLFGEKLVLRLLNSHHLNLDTESLGLHPEQHQLLLTTLSRPQGLILVTGPTGSGKTMTLYSAIQYINTIEKNISTVEDPIEMELQGINQVNINPKIGLDFSSVLRTFLRQDPDIIMIGEIRDKETAHMAMQAAQTGHLVLSTLHTNSAAETLVRLQSLGVTPSHIKHSLSLIIAQRLIRILCASCKQWEASSQTYHASSCTQCHQGYQGRVGIFELLSTMEKLTTKSPSLWEAGWQKVQQGITSNNELTRVLGKK